MVSQRGGPHVAMFEGFESSRIETSGATINLVHGGSGPPLLLLHGYPQTLAMWHRVAPRLAERFTVVACDLRGYGDSSKPPGGAEHAEYSKRALAQDAVEVMAALGHERFAVAGHDRGARVGHRLALDHAARVERLALLDIVPTHHVYSTADSRVATLYYHWFFLIQPPDLPERLIGADPVFYLHSKLDTWSGGADEIFAAEAVAEYERCFADPAAIHASCEDYRAGASIDLEHDAADGERKIECPLLVLWGVDGALENLYGDVLAVWRPRAREVAGRALPCGHCLAEEAPAETTDELLRFLDAGSPSPEPSSA